MIGLKSILEIYGVKEKGFSRFYTNFKLKLKLLPKVKAEGRKVSVKNEADVFKPGQMPNLSLFKFDGALQKVPSNNIFSSSSEKAVVASSVEQVDKRGAETLNKLVQTYASLYIKSILDTLSKAQKSISLGEALVEDKIPILDYIDEAYFPLLKTPSKCCLFIFRISTCCLIDSVD